MMTLRVNLKSLIAESIADWWKNVSKRWKRQKKTDGTKQAPSRDNDLYRFKATILDRLDDQFAILKRMKQGDRDAYNLYRKAGAFVTQEKWVGRNAFTHKDLREVDGWWKGTRPAFAAFYWGHRWDEEAVQPAFMYFQKFKLSDMPINLERVNSGDVYVMTVYWDLQGNTKPIVASYGVHIDADGGVRLLRSKVQENRVIRAKTRRNRDSLSAVGTFTVPSTRWGIDPFFKMWADDTENDSAASLLLGIFVYAMDMYTQQHSEMTKIRVQKDKLSAVFSLDILKTSYFFKDREYVTTPGGTRKPIFHIVRAHKRVLADGRERYIKTHFRGHRKFIWNGYHVSITVPGWHHVDMAEFDGGAHDLANDDPRLPDMVYSQGLGDWIIDVEEQDGRRVSA